MTRDEFDIFVKRSTALSQRRPRKHRLIVAALAAIGYTYIFLVLVVMLALTVAVIALVLFAPNFATIKIGLFVGVVTGGVSLAILKALWVRLPPPDGIFVKPAEAPALFSLIAELATTLRAPLPDHVMLVPEYNAAVLQLPRLGVFGWYRNYLMMGLPLMHSLGPQEFRAVMAHEFAHLSGNHSRFNAWTYRVRRTWERIFDEMSKREQRGAAPLTIFMNWFWPRFNAHAFVLARANEYEADACSAQIAGTDITACALIRINIHSALLDEKFWPEVFRQATTLALPPQSVFADLAVAISQPLSSVDVTNSIKTALLLETNNLDTHPCLSDRLKALGVAVESGAAALPPATTATAAQTFLGEAEAAAFAIQLSQRWLKSIEPDWKLRYEQAVELRERLASLEQKETAALLWERARIVRNLEGEAAALPVAQRVLELEPLHAKANFVCGLQALRTDEPRGVEMVERAIAADSTLALRGCVELHAYYSRIGQREKLNELEIRIDEQHELMARSAAERNIVAATDSFTAHDLSAVEVQQLREIFAAEADIRAVDVARKQLEIFPQLPLFVISVCVRRSGWTLRQAAANKKLIGRLVPRIRLSHEFHIFIARKSLKALGEQVSITPGARIFDRSRNDPAASM